MRNLRILLGFLRNRPQRYTMATIWAALKLNVMVLFRLPRRSIKAMHYRIRFENILLFKLVYEEIFLGQAYRIDLNTDRPIILDAGANIGITTLYFKLQYPRATIQAFEPDKANARLLRKNIAANQLTDVEVHESALSDRLGGAELHVHTEALEGGDVGASLIGPDQPSKDFKSYRVPTEVLSQYIVEQIDLVKLDIEGAEGPVMNEIRGKLSKVRYLIIECHLRPQATRLSAILSIIEENDFEYQIFNWSRENNQVAYCMIKAENRRLGSQRASK